VAILIPLQKVEETNDHASYDALNSAGSRVRLVVNKADGTITVNPDQSEPEAMTEFVISRATGVLRRCWESGEFQRPLTTGPERGHA